MHRDDEIQSGDDGGKSGDENASCHRDDMRIRVGGAVRRVERPAGIDPAVNERPQRERAARNEQIPARTDSISERRHHARRSSSAKQNFPAPRELME